ncbi:hypothetical protein [uncultured Pseudoteredinibacter sp.]|uniref:hypothetical protein n=1 Tax=uncultured Pseudoteredinibacter sp. TaxID=1641701 RepID=UPI00261FE3F6|nr:hypothetical protein [uncultured Pseudoteredinibacter sp.]
MGEIRADQHQLVVFFEGAEVSRQMLVEEFESVLDGFVPLVDYIGRRCQCAFLLVNPDLSVDAVVFFHLNFDVSGRPDLHWNTPIKQLACQASSEHSLDCGIRIASYSNCSIAWHQQKLWEPFAEQLDALCRVIKENQLGLGQINRQQSLTSEIPALQIDDSEAPLVLTNLASHVQSDIDEPVLEKQRKAFEQQINLQQLELAKLRDQNSALNSQIKHLESRFQKSLYDTLSQTIEQREVKWQAKLRQAKLYIKQQARQIKDLESELEQELGEGFSDQASLLKQLQLRSVKLHVDHPGIGVVHIPYDEVVDYLAAPLVYVANLCGVSPDVYGAWLKHRHQPICQGFDETGVMCKVALDAVRDLSAFVPGRSDFCVHHQCEGSPKESLA